MTFCHLISQICSEQDFLNSEIQTPAVSQSATHQCKAGHTVPCRWLYEVSLFKSKGNPCRESGMDVEDHEGWITNPSWEVVSAEVFWLNHLERLHCCGWCPENFSPLIPHDLECCTHLPKNIWTWISHDKGIKMMDPGIDTDNLYVI